MATNPQELQKIDELLVVIDRCSPQDEAEFAHEHIQEARTYLLGAMPTEFKCTLDLAGKTLARMNDTEARRNAQKILACLSEN